MPKVKVTYIPSKGLFQDTRGEGFFINSDTSVSELPGLDVTRNVTFRVSKQAGVSEISGSLLQLKGKQEGLHFHMGGNQYISNNAWFDKMANDGTGSWVYETDTSAAFRWGFRASKGCFDLEHAIGNKKAGQIITGTIHDVTGGSWGMGLSLTASNGAVCIGKRADRLDFKENAVTPDVLFRHGANAQFDVTGSVAASPTARSLAMAVTGSVELGCGAPNAFFLLPRITTTERNAITAVNGMVIYNTSDDKFQGYQAGSWQNLISE